MNVKNRNHGENYVENENAADNGIEMKNLGSTSNIVANHRRVEHQPNCSKNPRSKAGKHSLGPMNSHRYKEKDGKSHMNRSLPYKDNVLVGSPNNVGITNLGDLKCRLLHRIACIEHNLSTSD